MAITITATSPLNPRDEDDCQMSTLLSPTNPYEELLASLGHDPTRIQALFEARRTEVNFRSRAKLLDDNFQGMQPDRILAGMLRNPDYRDGRNNLCIWARPTAAVKRLIWQCQSSLQKLSPSKAFLSVGDLATQQSMHSRFQLDIWLMPQDCLHMTVFIMAHSLTPEALAAVVDTVRPSLRELADFHLSHRTRLVKPRLSFDDAGVALTYVPAAGEIQDDRVIDGTYTYLHLRRDLFSSCLKQGLEVSARHPPTSCHVTVARFITQDHGTGAASWVRGIKEINEMLAREYWPREGAVPDAGNWVLGEQIGFDIRNGTCWYGGGYSLQVGRGL